MTSDSDGSVGCTQIAGSSIASPEWLTGAVSPSEATIWGDSAACEGDPVPSSVRTAATIENATAMTRWRVRASSNLGSPNS